MNHTRIANSGETARARAPLERWLALGGVVGPLAFVVAFGLAGILRPGYSPVDQTVSDLGIDGNAWIVNASLVLLGVALIALAIGFYRAVRPPSSTRIRFATAAMTVAVGIGFAAAGIFPETDPGLHYTGALVFFVGAPSALILAGLLFRRDSDWRAWAGPTLVLGLATVILIVLTFYTFSFYRPTSGPEMIGRFGGLMERIVFVEVLAWYAILGWRLVRAPSQP